MSAAGQTRRQRTRRRLLRALLGVLVLVGLVLLVERAAGAGSVVNSLRRASPRWLGVAVAAETISFCAFAVVLRAVLSLRDGALLSWRTALRLVFASLGASRVVPAGGPAGIAVFVWAARRSGFRRGEATTRVLALYALLFAVFAAATWVCAATVVATGGAGQLVQPAVAWLVGVPLVVLAAAAVRVPARRRYLPGTGGRWLERARAQVGAVVDVVREPALGARRGALLLGAAGCYWLGDAACLWAGLRAFDVSLAPDRLLLAYSTAYLVTLLPLPFGGVGTVEATEVLVLRLVGVPVSAALFGALAYRAINFWLPTLPGLTSFATLRPLGRRLAESHVPRTS